MINKFIPNFLLNNYTSLLTSGVPTSAVLPQSKQVLVTVWGDGNVKIITNNITSANFNNSLSWPNGCRDILNTSDNNIHMLSDDNCYINIVGGE